MSERTIIDKAWDAQRNVEKRWDRIGKGKYARVLRMARKPEPEEFKRSSSIVLIGIAVIGGVGFFIYLIMDWLMKLIGAV